MEQHLDLQRLILTMGNKKDSNYHGKMLSVFGANMKFDLREGLPLSTTNQIDLGVILKDLINELNNSNNDELTPFSIECYNYLGFYKFVGHYELYNLDTPNIPTNEMEEIRDTYRYKLPRTLSSDEFESKLPKQYLDMKLYIPKCDIFKECNYNIAFYSTLLMILAERANMVPRFLFWSCGHVTLDENYISAAKTELERTPFSLPKLMINPNVKSYKDYTLNDFQLYEYESHRPIVVNTELV